MKTSFMGFGNNLCRGLASVSVSLLMVSSSFAQWPTSYLEPKVLWTGADLRAGDVMAFADGRVMVCHDRQDGAVRRLRNPIYDASGNILHPGDQLYTRDNFCVKAILLPPDGPDRLAHVAVQFADKAAEVPTFSYIYQRLSAGNAYVSASSREQQLLEGAIYNNRRNYLFLSDPVERSINGAVNSDVVVGPRVLTKGTAQNFFGHAGDTLSAVVAFERAGRQPDTPSEVWTYLVDAFYTPPVTSSLLKAADQPGESQTKPEIAEMSSNRRILAWIGSIGSEKRLYAKVISNLGESVSPARNIMNDVVDYTVTSSTLGHPVFAAVQRNDDVNPPVDTLFAGLIDAGVGAYVAIPMTTGLGIKVKALRQESNGDFSLIYSIPEAGTTLLKVLRISGTTAETLWETTVADLGIASDEVIERFPNTFVSSTAGGVLYFLTRYDKPYTNTSSYMLWRLGPDGHLGGDPLVAPANVSVSRISNTSADVTWTDTNMSETGYVIGRKAVGASEYSIIGSVGANTTTYQDLSVPAGQSHYVVAAYDETTGNYVLSSEVLYSP